MPDPLKLDTLVELLDQYSNVYPSSPSGARGRVRARRELPQMEPEVYIVWDKAHWRYHGERDGWTYEHHFRPVDDTVPDLIDTAPNLTDARGFDLSAMVDLAKQQVEAERCPHCGGIHAEDEAYLDMLAAAEEAALNSDAFFMVTVGARPDGDHVVYEPQIFSWSLTETAHRMIESQLVQCAIQLLQEHLTKEVNDLEGRGQ